MHLWLVQSEVRLHLLSRQCGNEQETGEHMLNKKNTFLETYFTDKATQLFMNKKSLKGNGITNQNYLRLSQC